MPVLQMLKVNRRDSSKAREEGREKVNGSARSAGLGALRPCDGLARETMEG